MIGALNSAMIGEGAKPKKLKNISSKIVEVWKELKNSKNVYKSSLGGRRQKLIGALNSAGGPIGEGAKVDSIIRRRAVF